MKLVRWCLLLGLSLSALSQASEKPHDYRHGAALQLAGEGPWYRLELPPALHFTARHADLRDLRIFNGEGEALAYALTLGTAQAAEQRQQVAVKWFPLMGDAAAPGAPAWPVPMAVSMASRARVAAFFLLERKASQPTPAASVRKGMIGMPGSSARAATAAAVSATAWSAAVRVK